MLGNTCEHTVKVGHCKHGAPNKVAKADEEFVGMEKLQMHANDDGISVLDACCECGGGNKDILNIGGGRWAKGAHGQRSQ